MRHGRRGMVATGIAVGALACAPAPAQAAVIPAAVSGGAPVEGGRISFDNRCVYDPARVAVVRGRGVIWSGSVTFGECPLTVKGVTEGTGIGPERGTNTWGHIFAEAGVYPYTSPGTFNSGGTVYVVGVRAVLAASPPVVFGTGPAQVVLDASASDVIDYEAREITEYAFDINSDGVYEQVGPQPTAVGGFPGPGDYRMTVRVTDDTGRTDTDAVTVSERVPTLPYDYSTPPVVAPTAPKSGTVKSTPKASASAARSIRNRTLRVKGLLVKVRAPRASDLVRIRLAYGSRTLASRQNANGRRERSIRLKLTKTGKKRVLKLRRRKSTKLRLTVVFQPTSGKSTTLKRTVTLRR